MWKNHSRDRKWSSFSDEEKNIVEISRSRMSGWQLEAFDKAYKEIIETGSSPIKKQKLQNQKN